MDTGGSDYFHVRPHAFAVGPQQILITKAHHDEAHLLLEARYRNTFWDKPPSQSTPRLAQPAPLSGTGAGGGGLAASRGQVKVQRHQSPTPRSTQRRSPTPQSTPRRQSLPGPSSCDTSPRSTPRAKHRTPDFQPFLRSLSAGSLPHFSASDCPPTDSLIAIRGPMLLSLLPVSVCDALPASALATASPPAGKESMATRLSQTVSSPSRYLPASMMGAPLAHEGLSSLGWA